MGYEENKPQINADERRFVASNPSLLIGSWVLAPYLFLSFSYGCFVNISAPGIL